MRWGEQRGERERLPDGETHERCERGDELRRGLRDERRRGLADLRRGLADLRGELERRLTILYCKNKIIIFYTRKIFLRINEIRYYYLTENVDSIERGYSPR